jgi:hypothetical protein
MYNDFVSKRVIGYTVIGLVVVAVLILVRFLVINGYSNKVTGTLPNVQVTTPGASPQSEKGTGTAVSTKISLVVTSPQDGSTLDSTNATVKGKTTPGADVFVNDQSGKADANGNFSISVGLDEGANQIVVSANDSTGNAAEQDLTVNVTSFQ